MNIIRLSETEHDARLSIPHNPPVKPYNQEAFDGEYYALYDKLERALNSQSEDGAIDSEDFLLEPHICESRGLGVEISNPAIICSGFIEMLLELIELTDRRWEIYLKSSEYDFGVFVGVTGVRVWAKSEEQLPCLW